MIENPPSTEIEPNPTIGYTDLTSQEEVEAFMGPEGGPVLIDFWGPTCGPCKCMAPHFEAAARAYEDEPIQFFKVNTKEQPRISAAFNIRSIPTVLLIHNGEILDAYVGKMQADKLAKGAEWLMSKARGEGFLSRLFSRRATKLD